MKSPQWPLFFLFIFAVIGFVSEQIKFVLPSAWPQLFFLFAFLLCLRWQNARASQVGILNHTPLSMALLAILFALLPAAIIVCTSIYFGMPFAQISTGFSKIISAYSLETCLLLFVLAPISEELFFRGVLFHGIKAKQATVFAVLLSSALFMASHSGWHWGSFVLGIVNCILLLKLHHLLAPILFHSIANFYPALVLAAFPKDGIQLLNFLN